MGALSPDDITSMTDKPATEKPAKGRPAFAKAAAGKKATDQEPIEKQLWKTADKLLQHIDAAEYKHIVHGLVFSPAGCRYDPSREMRDPRQYFDLENS